MEHIIRPIAHIRSDFTGKFGIPRQSGICTGLRSEIIFEPEYRSVDALRGIEDFSHLWLIWQFSANLAGGWSPTVRPPRLGGNRRMGVFATRSPYRPNALGLSCVVLEEVAPDRGEGKTLIVSGADLMDGTPIFDIKPYAPYSDAFPDARCAFASPDWQRRVRVEFPAELLERFPAEKRQGLITALEQDPRPAYQAEPGRVYGMSFAGRELRFRVADGVLTVIEVGASAKDAEQ